MLASGLLVAACTLRLGGPGPLPFTAAAFVPLPGEDAAALAGRIAHSAAGVTIVLADRETEWFRTALGEGENRILPSGIGGWKGGISAPALDPPDDPSGVPALRGPSPLTPPLLAEGRFRMGRRPVHVLGARIPAADDEALRGAAAALLARIAEESGSDTVVLLAVALEDPSDGEELDALFREYLLGPERCREARSPPPGLRLYRAPAALSECAFARTLDGTGILLGLATTG
jgi:hypothetical protein